MQKFPYFVKFDSLEGIDEFYKQMEEEGYELKKLWPRFYVHRVLANKR